MRGLELVSIDAMAVYRGLDIGTETPCDSPAPWHLVDIADPHEEFSVARFQEAAREALGLIRARGHLAVLVGGTGLYHRAVIDDLDLPGRFPAVAAEIEAELASGTGPTALAGLYERLQLLDPLAAGRIEPGNARRILRALEVTLGSGRPFSSFGPGLANYEAPAVVTMAGLTLERAELDRRLEARLDGQMDRGFLEEVAALSARPGGISRTARQAIGYRELLSVVEEGVSLAEARKSIIRRLRVFARRQEAWFRRDPRVRWFDASDTHLSEAVLDWWRSSRPAASWETGGR